MKEYKVELSNDGYWDNIERYFVVAENVEDAVEKAKKKAGGSMYEMRVEEII